MAPVGRWQRGKDLNWYAKNDTSPAALSAAEARKEEIRKIKEAEESALSEALGYGPTVKKNANETPIGKKEVERAIKETAEGDEEDGAKGVGFGVFSAGGPAKEERDVLGGVGLEAGGDEAMKGKRKVADDRDHKRRRSRSRGGSRDRKHRRHTYGDERPDWRHRSRNGTRRRSRDISRDRHSHRRDRSRDYGRWRDNDRPPRRLKERSYSPGPERRRRYSGDRDYDDRR
jgi:hypothetical protein